MNHFSSVLITGASAGIGFAIAEALAEEEITLILTSNALKELEELKNALEKKGCQAKIETRFMDVASKDSIQNVFSSIDANGQCIDVLINNAGLALGGKKPLVENELFEIDAMVDVNVKGYLYVTKIFLPMLLKQEKAHIINMGSITGEHSYAGGVVYSASKAAVHSFSEGLRMELVATPVRVTNIEPGMVRTDFHRQRFNGDAKKADEIYEGIVPLEAKDVSDAVVYALKAPLRVQVSEIALYPTNQANVCSISRKK